MRYKVLESFKIKTLKKEMELQAGQVVTLPHDKAIILISEGKITPFDDTAYRVYSENLHAYLWVVEDDKDIDRLREQGIKEAIYTRQEIEKLKDIDKDSLKVIHRVKEVFESSKVVEIKGCED
ncbi:MAG: hypothetical protein A2Y97_00060 [Nitrospirae bacterium RBG_13_39_12]|nr:MAG: hypothetical protein A2Y97_00060 [Nitrospirae bacterium RBG_13_39_12]